MATSFAEGAVDLASVHSLIDTKAMIAGGSMIQALMLLVSISTSALADGNLSTVLTDVRNARGHVLVSLYNKADGFPDTPNKALKNVRVRATAGSMRVAFRNLPVGDYAVVYIHDENDNLKLDTGAFGIPEEGFGFSNNPSIGMSAPRFEECQFPVRDGNNEIRIRSKYY